MDLKQKSSFATEDVKRYDESSANGSEIKNLRKLKKIVVFFNLNLFKFAKRNDRNMVLNNASIVFLFDSA